MLIPVDAAQAVLGLTAGLSPTPSPTIHAAWPRYTVSAGATGPWSRPDDTPAMSFIDKDGTYYYQSSDASYGITQTRQWHFWTGEDIDHSDVAGIAHAVNPANPLDRNDNTTWRCNSSPTGSESTYRPDGVRSWPDPMDYSQKNYCDLMGLWVDPDTGDWYGLVHNEFTPAPFGDRMHFDAVDLALSRDQGATWTIREHILTSPYRTVRNDTATFPESTYYWGNGDQRFHADISSGYFYVWYGSRVVDKGTNGTWHSFGWHVARAPMAGKLAAGSWRKYYAGKWGEPGVGGRESSLFPVDYEVDGWEGAWREGYIDPGREYDPKTKGDAESQIENGKAPPTSPLFWMDVSYSAHLGLWIGQPNHVNKTGVHSQKIYGTDNLATQKWRLLGDTGDYKTSSAYRFMLDGVSRTGQWILGKEFRGYCSFGCSEGRASEYVNLAVDGPAADVVDTTKRYAVVARTGAELSDALGLRKAKWTFKPTGDGAYVISSDHGVLSVGDKPSQRGWDTPVTLARRSKGAEGAGIVPAGAEDASKTPVGQQWWVIPTRDVETGEVMGARMHKGTTTFRLVNRYSGLALAVTPTGAVTVPPRSWTATGGVGRDHGAAEQELVLIPT